MSALSQLGQELKSVEEQIEKLKARKRRIMKAREVLQVDARSKIRGPRGTRRKRGDARNMVEAVLRTRIRATTTELMRETDLPRYAVRSALEQLMDEKRGKVKIARESQRPGDSSIFEWIETPDSIFAPPERGSEAVSNPASIPF